MTQEIWLFQKGYYAVHIMDTKLKLKLDFLKNFKRITTYYDSNGVCGWDFLLPADMYTKVSRWIKQKVSKGNKKVVSGWAKYNQRHKERVYQWLTKYKAKEKES